jgi:sortase A
MSRKGKILRSVLHFVASVLITSGILMLIDAGLTVTWQEPVSAFIAQREQDTLAGKLDRAPGELAAARAATANERNLRRRVKRLAGAWRRRVSTGDPIGRINLPTLHRRYVVVQGTDLTTLRKGPGHYPKTSFPGEGGTVAIAGHRTTYLAPFRTIDKLRAGQPIVLEMPYARLTYAVERTKVVPPTAIWITNRVPGAERLVLSACHPLYSASHRIVAFARLRSVAPR